MPVYESLVSNNLSYASTFSKGDLPLPPSKHLTVGKSTSTLTLGNLGANQRSHLHGC